VEFSQFLKSLILIEERLRIDARSVIYLEQPTLAGLLRVGSSVKVVIPVRMT